MRGFSGPKWLPKALLSTVLIAVAPLSLSPVLAGDPPPAPPASDEKRQPETDPSPLPERICRALAIAAEANDLPVAFFTRLIWQESWFNPNAVSRAGAQGVAQFMPGTARLRGLADPFDPFAAIAKSAQHLRDLNRAFGNLGLRQRLTTPDLAGFATGWPVGDRSPPKRRPMFAS